MLRQSSAQGGTQRATLLPTFRLQQLLGGQRSAIMQTQCGQQIDLITRRLSV
ncbi:hypothetical protein D3C71_1824730 [compost metagenome]